MTSRPIDHDPAAVTVAADPTGATVGQFGLAYCSPASVVAGEPVALHISCPGDRAEIEVVRDGDNPAVVWRATEAVDVAAIPPDAPERGCRWPATITITTGASWRSGLYLVRLRRPDATAHDAVTAWFVVRSPHPEPGRILLALATNTWNAYNDTGGRNLYTGAVELSFCRPLALGMLEKPDAPGARLVTGAAYGDYTAEHGLSMWHGMAGWAGQERRFAIWAERAGIELEYATNADLEHVDRLLDGCALLLSVGHDEYWTWGMRDAVEAFVDDGGNVAFLSGNTCYWQVRLDGDRMIGYKHRFAEDPVYQTDDRRLTTTMWADPIVGRPEAALTGVSFTRGGYARTARSVRRGSGGYEIHRPDHWLLQGTRLKRGDVLGGAAVVVGYECDGCDLALRDGLPVATGDGGTPADFEVVATAPATPFDRQTTPLPLAPGGQYELEFHARRLLGDDSPANCDRLRHGHAVLGTYRRDGGGTVVTCGCTEWAYGLDDPAIDTVTRNLIASSSNR